MCPGIKVLPIVVDGLRLQRVAVLWCGGRRCLRPNQPKNSSVPVPGPWEHRILLLLVGSASPSYQTP